MAAYSEEHLYAPVFDKGLEVQGEAHAQRQQRRVFLQHFGQHLEICLTVFVGKLSSGQLHLVDTRKDTRVTNQGRGGATSPPRCSCESNLEHR